MKSKKKANEPRKHHYVPVFYQKKFTNENGLLWVYDRLKEIYKELHPRVICFENDFYAVKPKNRPSDMQVELNVLSRVDSAGDAGIREFQRGRPSSEAEQAVACFMAFQATRVPTISRDVRVTYAKAVEQINRLAFANVEMTKHHMEQYSADTGQDLNVTPESIVEFVQGNNYEIVATETAFLTTMMEQSMKLMNVLLQLDWEVLVANEDTGFILCDCPVAVVPPKGSGQVGFLIPGSAKYFPLSRQLCLRLGDPGRKREFRKISKLDVRIVNQNIAANSERFIMCPSKVQLENVVSRSGCAKMESTPRFIIETVEANEDGSLQKISAQPRRYFYPTDGSICAT